MTRKRLKYHPTKIPYLRVENREFGEMLMTRWPEEDVRKFIRGMRDELSFQMLQDRERGYQNLCSFQERLITALDDFAKLFESHRCAESSIRHIPYLRYLPYDAGVLAMRMRYDCVISVLRGIFIGLKYRLSGRNLGLAKKRAQKALAVTRGMFLLCWRYMDHEFSRKYKGRIPTIADIRI